MKALSIRSPWWWWIVRGEKPLENRDWPTRFRGRHLIHASKTWARGDVAADYSAGVEMGGSYLTGAQWQQVRAACGCLIGAVDLVDCVEQSASPWFVGRCGFAMRNPVQFAVPIPYRGALGFFDVPDVLVQSIAEMRSVGA